MSLVQFFTSFVAATIGVIIGHKISKGRILNGKAWFPRIVLPSYAERILVACLAMLATFTLIEDVESIFSSGSSENITISLGSKYGLVFGFGLAALVIGRRNQKGRATGSSQDGA